MNIYKISQDYNNNWDTYDSAVVIAENEEAAALTSPCDYRKSLCAGVWVDSPEKVKVELLGKARAGEKPRIVVASYKAG